MSGAPLELAHHIARYEFANSNPRTPCTDGRWQAGAYVQCEGPRLYEARWRRLTGTPGASEGRYVPDRGLLCEPHARAFVERHRLYMPGEEPKEVLPPQGHQNGPLQGSRKPPIEQSSIRTLGAAPAAGTAVCALCYPAWGGFSAGAVHLPSPGGCVHGCHQEVPA